MQEERKVRVLLVGANLNEQEYFEESFQELEGLAIACHMEVVGNIVQNLKEISSSFYIGTGKVEEIREKAKELGAEIIVFNNELSPMQLKNLEDKLDIPVIDRTGLILEIFSSRAKTKEAKLQVETARLQYMLPRLVGLNSYLSRQGGGSAFNNKGSGEKKLELDRRKIEERLTELRKRLEELQNTRENQRKQRKKSGLPQVALVGYTNAGKSTIMNAILNYFDQPEEKQVLEQDMLFATLETTIRNITLEDNKQFLLSDTVGFIRQLPHSLIKAFRSTLEEVKQADLLLHVIDYSDPNFMEQMKITKETLKEIGADEIPVIYVYNKSDLMLDKLPFRDEDEIYISASQGRGIKELIEMISEKIFSDYVNCQMLIPFDKGNIVSFLNEVATVKKTQYLEQGTLLELNCKLEYYHKYQEFVVLS